MRRGELHVRLNPLAGPKRGRKYELLAIVEETI